MIETMAVEDVWRPTNKKFRYQKNFFRQGSLPEETPWDATVKAYRPPTVSEKGSIERAEAETPRAVIPVGTDHWKLSSSGVPQVGNEVTAWRLSIWLRRIVAGESMVIMGVAESVMVTVVWAKLDDLPSQLVTWRANV